MPDVYATITAADIQIQQRLADVLELRAADPQQKEILKVSLSRIDFPADARVLEIGCGTGAVMRALGTFPAVAEVTGVDPSPVFLAKARELAVNLPHLRFVEADGRQLPFGEKAFDVVIFHTVLCHVPEPERALAEAFRVLRPGGTLSVFDGDYTTMTVQIAQCDPLQTCVDTTREALVHDPWLVRRLNALVQKAGFVPNDLHSYGYIARKDSGYMLTLIDRGADILAATGRITMETAVALKVEAQSRLELGTFFGYIAYASLTARRPEV
jgi:ubiquinone/menaquinone biosynthesis C-methylase UbiE